METENNMPVWFESVADTTVVHVGSGFVTLELDEVQRLVQHAYDRHGVLASPSYALEAERATERKPGQCPCDTEGCSDRSGDGPDPIREGLQRVFA